MPCEHIKINDLEFMSGFTSPQTVKASVEQYHQNGFVILENAVSHSSIDKLRTRMLEDSITTLSNPKLSFNQGNTKNNTIRSPVPRRMSSTRNLCGRKYASG